MRLAHGVVVEEVDVEPELTSVDTEPDLFKAEVDLEPELARADTEPDLFKLEAFQGGTVLTALDTEMEPNDQHDDTWADAEPDAEEVDPTDDLSILLEKMQCHGYEGARGVEDELCAVCNQILSVLPATVTVPRCIALMRTCAPTHGATQGFARYTRDRGEVRSVASKFSGVHCHTFRCAVCRWCAV